MFRVSTLKFLMPLALTVMFGLQLLRIWINELFNYLNEVAGIGYAGMVVLAVLVFAATFLAGGVQRVLKARTLLLVGAGVGALRLIEQLSTIPALDMVITTLGLALFLVFIPVAYDWLHARELGRYFAPAVLLGCAADTALKGAFGTVDLSWVDGALPLVIVGGLVIVQIGLLRAAGALKPGTNLNRASWALLGLGPILFLQLQLFQNIGHITVVTGFSQPLAFELIVLGNALALVLAANIYGRLPRRAWTWTLMVGLVLLIVSLPLVGDPLAALEVLAGQAAAAVLLSIGSHSQTATRRSTAVIAGVSLFLMFGLLLGYYIGHVFKLPVPFWLFQPMAVVIIVIGTVIAVFKFGEPQALRLDWTPGLIGLGLMIVPVIMLVVWREPGYVTGHMPVRIMSYNLHSAFDVTGRLDLEAVARTIESEQPDIVALQEVSRGWVLSGSTDMLAWLSQRLQMPYVWGPTADPMWGNALLSRYPVVDVQLFAMPNNAEVRPMRGYLVADVAVGDRAVRVIGTHLHHVEEDSVLRVPQVQAILATWGRAPATVILGDLNAVPDAPEMALMRDAGLVDAFAQSGAGGDGFTYASNAPAIRIDYIYHSPDLISSHFHINDSQASDHKGIAVTIAPAQ